MRLIKSESGAAFVELAVVAPFLALLLLGVVDFGRYTYDGLLAANAARAGAQYGAQTLITAKDTTGITNAALADAQSLSGLTVPTATAVCMVGTTKVTCGTANETVYVQVNTTGTFSPTIKYPLLPSTVTVSGSALVRVEQQ
jgi:Flp pilus assembly protein TadG